MKGRREHRSELRVAVDLALERRELIGIGRLGHHDALQAEDRTLDALIVIRGLHA